MFYIFFIYVFWCKGHNIQEYSRPLQCDKLHGVGDSICIL